ncbi:MAG TPA: hypothetical protein GXX46_11140 [Peptococcaceae bacterium]|nr:hypothetical protein [Peptococcaceae bacterium]
MADKVERQKATPQETGEVLYYLVGSETNDFLCDLETLEKIGLGKVDRDDLYIETAILNMFIMIKQYTRWERDEDIYNEALDRMHFLLFHQLKELSNYDEDDIEELHRHIFARYDQYSDAIETDPDNNWLKALAGSFLDNINDELEDREASCKILAKQVEKFYKAIPNMLNAI